MRKVFILTLAAVMVLGCFSGCGREQAQIPEETACVPQNVSVNTQAELEGKTLTIDTQVTLPDLSKLEKITLSFDEEAFQRAGQELVLAQYPHLKEEYKEDGSAGWSEITEEGLGIIFDGWKDGFEAGRCYYENLNRELNGQSIGDDGVLAFEPYYLTEHIPNKLGMTSGEAAERIAGELVKYSCFTYEPWNVTACNIREKPESSGYYSAIMQPHFDGWPVYGHGALRASTHMSAEGLFAFQGIMVLKERERTPVSCTMDLDTAVERFREEFVEVALRDRIVVDRITAGYLASSEYDGTWTLHPAWVFEYRDMNEDHEYNSVCAYKMETGTLFILN